MVTTEPDDHHCQHGFEVPSFCDAVAVQQLQKEASNYRTLRQYKEQFAVASAAPEVSSAQTLA